MYLGFHDLRSCVSCVGNHDMTWSDMYKTQEVLETAVDICIIVTLLFSLKYIAFDKEVTASWGANQWIFAGSFAVEVYWALPQFFVHAALLKWNCRTNLKTKHLNLHTALTTIPSYMNSNIEDHSPNCKVLYSEISLPRHGQDFLFLGKGIIR